MEGDSWLDIYDKKNPYPMDEWLILGWAGETSNIGILREVIHPEFHTVEKEWRDVNGAPFPFPPTHYRYLPQPPDLYSMADHDQDLEANDR